MADQELIAKLREGVSIWNRWADMRDVVFDLSDADLRGMNLGEVDLNRAILVRADLSEANLEMADLSGANLRGAKLSKAYLSRLNLSEANLREADLSGSNLNWADLREADLRKADLSHADLRQADVRGANLSDAVLVGANLSEMDLSDLNLSGADLRDARLYDADLSGTNLRQANLRGARLKRANLRGAEMNDVLCAEADLNEADLSAADLSGANLTGADLRSARLQMATLNNVTLSAARLWETQRSGWSIHDVACAWAFWDEAGKEIMRYEAGEFERLYSSRARIELIYQGGITAFEVNTLPALLHHLAVKYPDCGVRLKSIEETGGGVKVSLHVEESSAVAVDAIREEAQRAQSAQIALRDDQIARLQIEKQLLLGDVLPRMLAAAGQHVEISGTATNLVIASGQASVRAKQVTGESEAILGLLQTMMGRIGEVAPVDRPKLEDAVSSVEQELGENKPKSSVLAAGLGVVKEIAVKVVESASEKALLEHWQPIVHQLGLYLSQVVH
ncbi:pentapeptide repeat-containing protein [Granulicella arctica]|uniref:pentapeptide repeat-containing protein n=1 Tax=Granulicella arctica TaxID=940613 RepID=UPI0021E0987D|nr:pentapeptide repeat-containing protein [Granulicella arctica]